VSIGDLQAYTLEMAVFIGLWATEGISLDLEEAINHGDTELKNKRKVLCISFTRLVTASLPASGRATKALV
jgi:hypothetical protein